MTNTKKLNVFTAWEGMVGPNEPTPSGMLSLSAIDIQPALRCKVHTLHVFRHGPNAAAVIREALSKALLHYYPLAGRLVVESWPLQVSCTKEGVWFVEAVAQCSLESINYLESEFTEDLRYELLPQPPPREHGFDPLVLMQVTRFSCKGFVMGLEFSHCVCDGLGASQFLKAVGEIARGLQVPTVAPEWCREGGLLASAAPLVPAEALPPVVPTGIDESCSQPVLKQANFDVSSDSIARLKSQFFELTGQSCSTFETLAASVWRCRAQAMTHNFMTNHHCAEHDLNNHIPTSAAAATAADNTNIKDKATLVFFANARGLVEPPLPKGFYGNCFFPVVVSVPMERLRCATHAETVKLIKEAKATMPTQFANWMALASTGSSSSSTSKKDDHDNNNDDDNDGYMDPFTPPLSYGTLFISKWGRLGFGDVDYGWGPPSYLVPVNFQNFVPVCIVGSPPLPHKGVRLMTWCVYPAHLNTFRQLLRNHL